MAEQIIPLNPQNVTEAAIPVAQYVRVVEQVNPWNIIFYAVLAICITAIIIFIIYDQRKRAERKPNKKTPPFVAAIIASLIIEVILLITVILTGEELSPIFIWVFPVMFLLVYAVQWNEYRKISPLKDEKLLEMARDKIKRNCLGRFPKGDEFGGPILYENILPNDKQPAPFNMSKEWLFRVIVPEGRMFIYLSQSLTSGDTLKYIEDPEKEFVEKRLGKEAADKYDLEKAFMYESTKPDVSIEDHTPDKEPSQNETFETI